VERIVARSPVTGEILKTFTRPAPQEIDRAIERARTGSRLWKEKSIKERLFFLSNLRKIIIQNLDVIVENITESTGKVVAEAFMTDILPTLDIMTYYKKNAEKILRPKKRRSSFIFRKHSSYLEYSPIGVILVISPWNCPFQLSLVPLVTALVAGNAVILKPSELVPLVGELIGSLCQKAGIPPDVVQVIQGGKEVGEHLIGAVPDKIFFTGSFATGKKIMEEAGRRMIPVELELGGKDPMIVFADSDFERAVRGAVYGAFANSGQLCVSVERLYVEEPIYEKFVEGVLGELKNLRLGTGMEADIGVITNPCQVQIMEEQIKDALEKGAKLLTGIRKEGSFFHPIVLKDVNHDMKIMKEETFGPVLPVMPFKKEEEAISLANYSIYGLNSSVWTRDRKKAKRVVRKLEVGNAYINDVVKNIGNPYLPFGGVKKSGFGRYHGPEGLYTFSTSKAVMVNRSKKRKELNWFPFSKELVEIVQRLISTLYGDMRPLGKFKNFFSLYVKMKKIEKGL